MHVKTSGERGGKVKGGGYGRRNQEQVSVRCSEVRSEEAAVTRRLDGEKICFLAMEYSYSWFS